MAFVPTNLDYSESITAVVQGERITAAEINGINSQIISDIKKIADGVVETNAGKIDGTAVDLTGLSSGDGMMYNGTSFVPVALFNGTLSTWTATKAVDKADMVLPTAGLGNFWQALNSGTTGGTEPTWTTTIGDEVTDGDITWKLVAQITGSTNAATADKLKTARDIGITGKATATAASFDGSQNVNINLTAVTATAVDSSAASSATYFLGADGTSAAAAKAMTVAEVQEIVCVWG